MAGKGKGKGEVEVEWDADVLRMPEDSETKLFELFYEHPDVISEASCMVTKHRKATTLDRNDNHLSWDLVYYGRTIPGFSSDC
ncbi:hypothetical protein B9479_007598, partial [Cryptococcus floricola]